MNENIDLTTLLRNCPVGWKFYSYVFGEETYFKGVSPCQGNPLPISIYGKYEGCKFQLSSKGHPYCDSYGECCIFPSKEQRDWSKFTAPWYKGEKVEHKKKKFNPKTLKPFNKVIIRDSDIYSWRCDFFSYIRRTNGTILAYRTTDECYRQCVPYNDETKHLIGYAEEAPDYYRYWER